VLALGLMAAVTVVWELMIRLFHVAPFVLPAPSAVIRSLIDSRVQLASATVSTSLEIVLGFVLAAVTGIAVALIIVRFERFGQALYPLVVLFQNVPKVALAPIFILWFGFDLAPKVVLVVVIAFFPVAIDMLAGLQSVDPSFVALMQSVGASRTQILLRVRIPHSLPHLMAGLKVAITFSVIGAIVGEFAGANRGLRQRGRRDTARPADLRSETCRRPGWPERWISAHSRRRTKPGPIPRRSAPQASYAHNSRWRFCRSGWTCGTRWPSRLRRTAWLWGSATGRLRCSASGLRRCRRCSSDRRSATSAA